MVIGNGFFSDTEQDALREMAERMAGEEARLVPYSYIVEQARKYINTLGGFERFAEWGLIR